MIHTRAGASSSLVKPSTQLGGIAHLALLAPVKPGFVPGAESFTYVKRLEALLRTANAIRLSTRESAPWGNPFPDAVGRWALLQSFRYALVPPEVGDDGGPAVAADADGPPPGLRVGTWRLYLSVTFDAGWEPYMRVIYRDIGPLLDAIFANCQGYLSSHAHDFASYGRWVRSREAGAGLFYAESARTVADQRLFEQADALLRAGAGPEAAARLVLAPSPAPDSPAGRAEFRALSEPLRKLAVRNNLRALKGLYDLRAAYAVNPDGDDQCLLRFAAFAMPEFSQELSELAEQEMRPPWWPLFQKPIEWLRSAPPTAPMLHPATVPTDEVQAGILAPYVQPPTHGVLLLLAVADAVQVRDWMRTLPLYPGAEAPAGLFHNLAFTRQGLQALGAGLGPEELARFPQEFIDGMEARAGLLGDVRGNHPDHWQRPRFHDRELDLRSVHLVLQLRLHDPDGPAGEALHPQLAAALAPLADQGLRVLAVEPMRSWPQGGVTREHFGFADGISQPVPVDQPPDDAPAWDHRVRAGEVLVGQSNDRGDRSAAAPDPLLHNGSFMVLRKIEQHTTAYAGALRKAAQAADPLFDQRDAAAQQAACDRLGAGLMGRRQDGTPLVPGNGPGDNDFDYTGDPAGAACPFASHVRRANPRAARDGGLRVPRLVRRGMSYGPRRGEQPDPPGTERGLFFMAYCSSLAEQFEVVQRWLTGGNSTGVPSTQSDPFLGVPDPRRPRRVQWHDGQQLVSVDLGSTALTTLRWGLYLFVPSRAGFRQLLDGPQPMPVNLPAPESASPVPSIEGELASPSTAAFEDWRRVLQDSDTRDAAWAWVNDRNGGSVSCPYGRLVSDPAQVQEILVNAGGAYSVSGFGRRFAASIGSGFLGMDRADHDRRALDTGIVAKLAAVTEGDGYAEAQATTQAVLNHLKALAAGQPAPVDIGLLGERVLTQLSKHWFGVPDGDPSAGGGHVGFGATIEQPALDRLDADPANGPRDFLYVSRYIFGAHPTHLERQRGVRRGKVVRQAIEAVLASGQALPPLAETVRTGLTAQGLNDEVAATLAGLVLGFAPTLLGNYIGAMRRWVQPPDDGSPSLWDLQVELLDGGVDAASFTDVSRVLRPRLMQQMRRTLVPATVWREKANDPPRDGQEPGKVIVGLLGLLQHPGVDESWMFGGLVRGGKQPYPGVETEHACPGYGMAVGVLLGMIAPLLLDGTLRPSPSPTILYLG